MGHDTSGLCQTQARFSNEMTVPASFGSRIFVRVLAHVSRAARFSVSYA